MSIHRRRPGRRLNASGAGLVLGALALYACTTYDDSLLSGAAASAGTSATAGASGVGTGGTSSTSGSAGTLLSGGAPTASAGSIGVAGDDSAGEAGSNTGGSVAGAAPGGAGSVGIGGNTSGGGTGGTGTVAGGTGGTGTVAGGSAGTGAVAGASSGGSGSLELIDDFEDLNKFVLLSHGRNGPWYVFNDGTAGATQSAFTIAAVTGAGDSPGSVYGLHMTGAGFTSWGAGEGADFVNTALHKAVYDVSAYSGVSFYAKIGVAGATTSVNVLFPDTSSDPDGGKCSGTGTSQCSDHLFLTVTGLKTTWAVYQVLFSKLGQVGYGLPQSKLDPTTVYSVQFTQSNTLPIDLWIDDLSFIIK